MSIKNILPFIITLTLLTGIVMGGLWFDNRAFSAVEVSNEYVATTTSSSFAGVHKVLKSSAGSVGSVTIGSTSAHTLTLWNATSTTDSASTTIIVLKASVAEGTYAFDSLFDRGLIVSAAASYAGSAVITWR